MDETEAGHDGDQARQDGPRRTRREFIEGRPDPLRAAITKGNGRSIMARRYASMKAGKLKHTANHIREAMGTDEELRALGASFVNRPVNPIICLPDLEVVDGNRRLAGVLLVAGPEAEVPVCITDERVDESAKLEIMIQSAIHTRGLSAYSLGDEGDHSGALAMHPGEPAGARRRDLVAGRPQSARGGRRIRRAGRRTWRPGGGHR
jgi:hypothetical protein